MLSIRTQDRMAIVPYHDKAIKIFRHEDVIDIIILTPLGIEKLGTYATKERALQVLDEIELNLRQTTKTFIDTYEQMYQVNSNLVYQMPKE